jgi:hypothetical protein
MAIILFASARHRDGYHHIIILLQEAVVRRGSRIDAGRRHSVSRRKKRAQFFNKEQTPFPSISALNSDSAASTSTGAMIDRPKAQARTGGADAPMTRLASPCYPEGCGEGSLRSLLMGPEDNPDPGTRPWYPPAAISYTSHAVSMIWIRLIVRRFAQPIITA